MGTKTICTVQDCPGCNTPQVVLATLNPISALTPLNRNAYLVLLVTVSVLGWLTEPALWLPNHRYPELRLMVPALFPFPL